MKRAIGLILLVLVIFFSIFLYRTGMGREKSLAAKPMKASDLQEKTAEPVEVKLSVPEESDRPEKTEEEKQKEDQEKAVTEIQEISAAEAVFSEETEAELREKISSLAGTWSAFVEYLPTGEKISIDSQTMVAASLIKLYIAGAYLEDVQNGKLDSSYDNDLKSMISQSDNYAANRLIRLVGMDRINEFIRQQGFEDTQLNRELLENNGLENYTSVNDCGDVLSRIYAGTYVSSEASEKILSAMKEQTVRTKIPAGLPEDVICANKTGELVGTENDTAIVYTSRGDYVFCVMSHGMSAGNAHSAIKDLSAFLYETVTEAGEASGQ